MKTQEVENLMSGSLSTAESVRFHPLENFHLSLDFFYKPLQIFTKIEDFLNRGLGMEEGITVH
jgi:hypothetical protein